uniref:Uncharacterized protein n=1 Tax=Panagrolaimus sp. JU765 TaxID=591449 RepID=A0AC34R673_9BILA
MSSAEPTSESTPEPTSESTPEPIPDLNEEQLAELNIKTLFRTNRSAAINVFLEFFPNVSQDILGDRVAKSIFVTELSKGNQMIKFLNEIQKSPSAMKHVKDYLVDQIASGNSPIDVRQILRLVKEKKPEYINYVLLLTLIPGILSVVVCIGACALMYGCCFPWQMNKLIRDDSDRSE